MNLEEYYTVYLEYLSQGAHITFIICYNAENINKQGMNEHSYHMMKRNLRSNSHSANFGPMTRSLRLPDWMSSIINLHLLRKIYIYMSESLDIYR